MARSKASKSSKPRSSALASRARRLPELDSAALTNGLLWIVVFGPGHGEAIVVRDPIGRVGIVDGCIEPEGDCPVTKLLKGVAPSELLFTCLTHPHEDHYKGHARLMKKHRGAVRFVWHVFSLAANEHPSLVRYAKLLYGKRKVLTTPDIINATKMDEVIVEIMSSHTHAPVPAQRARLQTQLNLLDESVLGTDFQIWAWGPTSIDLDEAHLRYLSHTARNRPKSDDLPNQVSGALFLRWGASKVLLAGDLYSQSQPHRGWGPARGLGQKNAPVQVVNVAHHASENAHDSNLWTSMSPGLAIVTPFRNAGLNTDSKPCQPPKPGDIERLLDSGSEVILTSMPAWLGAPKTPGRRLTDVVAPSASAPAGRAITASRHMAGLTGCPAARDANSGVAVALDSGGNVVEIILLGDADFYA